MTSKGAKEIIANRMGFKSSSSASKAEAELERVRKENAHLRRKIEEVSKRHANLPDSDKSKLLEMVASLQAQLEQRRKDADHRDASFQNLTLETEKLKNQLVSVSTRCQSLETQVVSGQVPPGDLALMQDQLRDALEKNQQWLAYDQQREAYVQSVHARILELEQQQSKPEAISGDKDAPQKSHNDQLLLSVKKDLESHKDQVTRTQKELSAQREQALNAQAELRAEKERVARLQEELSALQRRYDDKCGELSSFLGMYDEQSNKLEELKIQLQAQRLSNRHEVSEERKTSSERADKLRLELESTEVRLEEERKRSDELLLQVNMLQKSLLSQTEERRRIAALEQKIQLSAADFESEKIDRQTMQQQLHKVLKELRKARDQISKLESAKQPNSRFSEPGCYSSLEFERLALKDPCGPTSPSQVSSLMDESFLECPNCHSLYPASRHKELLAHIDRCFA